MLSDTFDAWVIRTFGSNGYTKPHAEEWLTDCPKPGCDAKKRFSMNPHKGLYNCYKCGGGRLLELLMEFGMSHYDAYKMLNDDEVDIGAWDSLSVFEPTPQKDDEPEDIDTYVSEFIPVDHPGLSYTLWPYILGRGFTIEYAKAWRLMYAPMGKFSGRLILPVYEDGKVVYFQGRDIFGDNLRYKNPRLPKGRFVFNGDYLAPFARAGEPVYICEGAFNAMSIGLSACAVWSHAVSPTQLAFLTMACAGASEVNICFDFGQDATESAEKLAMSLALVAPAYVTYMPTDNDLNDYFQAYGHPGVMEVVRGYRRLRT